MKKTRSVLFLPAVMLAGLALSACDRGSSNDDKKAAPASGKPDAGKPSDDSSKTTKDDQSKTENDDGSKSAQAPQGQKPEDQRSAQTSPQNQLPGRDSGGGNVKVVPVPGGSPAPVTQPAPTQTPNDSRAQNKPAPEQKVTPAPQPQPQPQPAPAQEPKQPPKQQTVERPANDANAPAPRAETSPRQREESRQRDEKGDTAAEKIDQHIQHGKEVVEAMAGRAAERAKDLGEKGKAAVKDLREKGKDALSKGAAAVHLKGDEELRREQALNQSIRESARLADDAYFDHLLKQVDKTRPLNREVVKAALKSEDPMMLALADLVTADDRKQVEAANEQIIEELYNEPQIASSKMTKFGVGLNRLIKENLFNQDVARRVRLFSAEHEAFNHDAYAAEIRNQRIAIGVGAVTLGALMSRNRPLRTVASRAAGEAESQTSRLGAVWERVTKSRMGQQIAGLRTRILGKGALKTRDVIERDLIELGVPGEYRKQLDLANLQPLPSRYFTKPGMPTFKATNIPGLEYNLITTIPNVWNLAHDEFLVAFRRMRPDRGATRPEYYAKRLKRGANDYQLQSYETLLKMRSPQQGGPQYTGIVATDGTVSASRLRLDELNELRVANNELPIDPATIKPSADAPAPNGTPAPTPAPVAPATSVPSVAQGEVQHGFDFRRFALISLGTTGAGFAVQDFATDSAQRYGQASGRFAVETMLPPDLMQQLLQDDEAEQMARAQ